MSKRVLFLIVPVLAGLAIVLGGGQTFAQGPAGGSPQAMVSPAFTYQGQLKDGAGNPIDNSCDFTFSLWDALSAGSQVGGSCTVPGVQVANGYFAAQVNAGGEFGASAFSGDARWLEIAVQCSGDPGYTTLAPRQELTAAPYALGLMPGARVVGAVSTESMAALTVENTDTSGATWGLRGQADSTSGSGVAGYAMASSGFTNGLYGSAPSPSGTGVYGSGGAYGVQGLSNATSGEAYGVFGQGITGVGGVSYATDGIGVFGANYAGSGETYGLYATASSPDGTGVYGAGGAFGYGVVGHGFVGVYGESASTDGLGVYGNATNSSGETYGVAGVAASAVGTGVYGYNGAASGNALGVYGLSNSTAGRGVFGDAAATSGAAYGVYGRSASTNGKGVFGEASATSGNTYGVYGLAPSTEGIGVFGEVEATSGTTYGVYGRSFSTEGRGVCGVAGATSGSTYGVYGSTFSPAGRGVYGLATTGSGTAYGVYGQSTSPDGRGVYGYASATTGPAQGVAGVTDAPGVPGTFPVYSIGVLGRATTTSGYGAGVWGQSSSPNGYGVFGINNAGYAGYFQGDVHVAGDLSASGAKPFKIDNPLDPAHQYLYHYSMESSEVLNQYSGNATLNAEGEAWVQLPDWFAAINKDFRYQLTPVGAAAPGLYIAQEVESTATGSRFQIAGGPAGLKVSWQVTALRSDPYIRTHGAPVVLDKPADEQGTYLHPELYGQPASTAVDYSNLAIEPVAVPAMRPR